MNQTSMLKMAVWMPGGILGTILYKLLLRKDPGAGDQAVVDKMKATPGFAPVVAKDNLKPWRAHFDTKANKVIASPKTHSGVLARELAISSNPTWMRMLRRTGFFAPALGSVGAWAAPTQETSGEIALGATALSMPRAMNTILGGVKGTALSHRSGGGAVSKILAAAQVPGAIMAATSPGLTYLARASKKDDKWWEG